MGLLRDRDAELSQLERMVVRLQDPARRKDMPPEDWPTAMVAYSLHMSEDPALLTEGRAVYADFAQAIAPPERLNSLMRLSGFICQRKGAGWRALLLYAMAENAPELCARAAALAVSCVPCAEGRFYGAEALVKLLAEPQTPPAICGGLLSLADLRLLPTLRPLAALPPARLRPLLNGLSTTLNSLSAACLLHVLEAAPSLSQEVTEALCRLASQTPIVADLALPLPTWAYERPTPQPLHAWSLPEFLPRLMPRLQPLLSPAQIDLLRLAFV